MPYGHTRTLDLPFEEAVTRVKDAFGAQGFGTLTEIDVQATLKHKLGHDTEPYLILGTCNPQLAHQALQIEPEIGLLLPGNEVVRRHAGTTLVHALEPRSWSRSPSGPNSNPSPTKPRGASKPPSTPSPTTTASQPSDRAPGDSVGQTATPHPPQQDGTSQTAHLI